MHIFRANPKLQHAAQAAVRCIPPVTPAHSAPSSLLFMLPARAPAQADLHHLPLTPATFGTKFDVVLVDPPWEEYVRRAPGLVADPEVWSWQQIRDLQVGGGGAGGGGYEGCVWQTCLAWHCCQLACGMHACT